MYDMYGNGMRENKILGWDRIGNEEVESISVFFLLVNEDGKQKRLPTTLLIFVTTTDEDENSGVFIDKTTTVAKT